MDERELVLRRGARAQGHQVARVGEMVDQDPQPIRTLRMAGSRVVLQHASIEADARARHAATIADGFERVN
jgi:hypothetical protein